MTAIFLALALTSFAAAAKAADLPADPAAISFKSDIIPLVKSRCVVCHMPGAAQAGLELHPRGGYEQLVGVKSTQSPLLRVTPGKPDESYLYRKLEGTHVAASGTGERMPFGEAPLAPDVLEKVRRWIEAGAKFD